MATLKDVAKASGLTVGTVSRVLNNRGYISDKTREKVYQVMKDLNYQPNETARAPEETTEQETFRYSVKYEAVIDTSDLTDQETSDMISNLRNIAQENNMKIGLGQARYQELVLEITCFYNDESITVNEVKEKLLSGLTIKSIQ